jgi:hypothetical protein
MSFKQRLSAGILQNKVALIKEGRDRAYTLGHVLLVRLNTQAVKESTEHAQLPKQQDRLVSAASRASSLLLAAQCHSESKKDQARYAPQDRDGYDSNRHTQQDHTHDQYKNIFFEHDESSFLIYFLSYSPSVGRR